MREATSTRHPQRERRPRQVGSVLAHGGKCLSALLGGGSTRLAPSVSNRTQYRAHLVVCALPLGISCSFCIDPAKVPMAAADD